MTDADDAALLVGYDASYVTIYDPVKGVTYRKSIEDADETFANAGSIFLTYLK